MLFNSPIFLFVFLPTVLAGFYALQRWLPGRAAVGFLVTSSLFFYGWWEPVYLALILGSIIFNYAVASALARPNMPPGKARLVVGIGIAANLGALGFFKYANFFIDSFVGLAGASFTTLNIILPLAISFFTFQQIAFLADVYRGKAKETDFLNYCLFVTFFPQLIAGPIVHHSEMMPQFTRQSKGSREVWENLSVGATIFTIGLFKKTIVADQMGLWSDQVFALPGVGVEPSFIVAWIGAACFTFQIYFDFSGYSDMAIGLGRLFGIRLPLNFASPYKAVSIIEFWGRWHMTLSRFLRDYLYIPLGGSRRGQLRRYVNMMVVMLLGGLWHGAAWTFVLWGGLHGGYLAINHAWRKVMQRFGARRSSPLTTMAGRVLTFLLVVVAWILFRANSFEDAMILYRGMLGLNGVVLPAHYGDLIGWLNLPAVTFGAVPVYGGFTQLAWIAAALLFVWVLPSTQELMRRFEPALNHAQFTKLRYGRLLQVAWRPTLVMSIITALSLTTLALRTLQGTSGEFIYFQF